MVIIDVLGFLNMYYVHVILKFLIFPGFSILLVFYFYFFSILCAFQVSENEDFH